MCTAGASNYTGLIQVLTLLGLPVTPGLGNVFPVPEQIVETGDYIPIPKQCRDEVSQSESILFYPILFYSILMSVLYLLIIPAYWSRTAKKKKK